ncbi:MAG: methionyl-tRNA formyltransferase [Alphaproteobacteria bacterium]|jgi:methionyl-tRNA formyltransferase|nr:methionyl-tRNA formyltransferase [Alphaproteobacteria bacterium]
MTSLRLAFMGTPDFAVPSLAALIAEGHDIAAVYTQPPRPAGRGHRAQRSPVHAFAAERGLPVRHPPRLKEAEEQARFAELGLDAAVVAAYGLILPGPVLAAPRLGCINVHASLLPRWRGAAPIQRALLAGDSETGVTIMQMAAGMDTGPMLRAESVPIGPRTTATDLHDTLAALGAHLLPPALEGVAAGTLMPQPQPEAGVTYAPKITREDGWITWQDAAYVDRQVRALNPWPGCGFVHEGETLRVLEAEPVAEVAGPPGRVMDERLTVSCAANGAVRLLTLQRPGRGPRPAEAFLRGFPIPPGTDLCAGASSGGEGGQR